MRYVALIGIVMFVSGLAGLALMPRRLDRGPDGEDVMLVKTRGAGGCLFLLVAGLLLAGIGGFFVLGGTSLFHGKFG